MSQTDKRDGGKRLTPVRRGWLPPWGVAAALAIGLGSAGCAAVGGSGQRHSDSPPTAQVAVQTATPDFDGPAAANRSAQLTPAPAQRSNPVMTWRRSPAWSGPQSGPADALGRPWTAAAFDDSSWSAASLPDNLDGSELGDRYYRGQFNWDGASALWIAFSADDGIAIYVNGQALGSWGQGWREPGCVNNPSGCGINASVPDVVVPPAALQRGVNTLAVDVWNGACSSFTVNLTLSTAPGSAGFRPSVSDAPTSLRESFNIEMNSDR
jgi:hypothetical protein